MVKAIFVDLGNVLVLNKSTEVYESWAEKINLSTEDLRSIMRVFNNSRMSGHDLTAEQFIKENRIKTINTVQLEELQKDIWGSEQVNKWLIDFITSNQGKYIFGIISNNFKEAEEIILNKFHIPKFYSVFVSSNDTKVLKPNKEIYEYALSKVNLPASECLFIDDSAENVEGARAIGMQAIQFTGNASLEKSLSALEVV